MLANDQDRGPPTALKGWLSDIYFPSLLDVTDRDKAIEALAQRLGSRATLDDPLGGRAVGLPAIPELLRTTAEWLARRAASYERRACTTGVDRDVTEGTLTLRGESRVVELPVAVVAERRRSREVELRVYFAIKPVRGERAVRAPLVPPAVSSADVVAPPPISDQVAALAAGRIEDVLACYEVDGVLRDARGVEHAKSDGTLRTFYEGLLGTGPGGRGLDMQIGASADDGRICALECTVTKVAGKEVKPQAALLVCERGDSALLRSVRLYDDIEI